MADDLELFADFLNSEGWRQFSEHATREWGPSGLRFQQTVRDAAAKKDGSADELNLILRLQSELIALLAWPKAQYDQAKQKRAVDLRITTPSRRGPGL
jgi:hypothetical protein